MAEELTTDEWNQVVGLMGSAPLKNMIHAQQVDNLIKKVMVHSGLAKATGSTAPKKKTAKTPRANFKK